jgi:hypothetical protein
LPLRRALLLSQLIATACSADAGGVGAPSQANTLPAQDAALGAGGAVSDDGGIAAGGRSTITPGADGSMTCTGIRAGVSVPVSAGTRCPSAAPAPCTASPSEGDALFAEVSRVIDSCGGLSNEHQLSVIFSGGCAARVDASGFPGDLELAQCVAEKVAEVHWACAAGRPCVSFERSTLL